MPFFIKPFEQITEIQKALEATNQPIVVCYCAAWCRTCESYLDAFKDLSNKFPELIFLWVDIEDEESLLDDLDVENFPTILIQKDDENLFYGTMLPYIGHLERMILNALDGQTVQSDDGPGPMVDLLEQALNDL